MTLSINAAATDSCNADENESPLGKRKSQQISPSCHNRGPLSDVTNPDQPAAAAAGTRGGVAAAATTASSTPSKPPTPSSRAALPPTYQHPANNANKFNKFKQHNRPSKDEIQATNDKHASVSQLSNWLANESAKKVKKPPIHHSATPVRFQTKPRIKQSDVEATDDKRVSVKTLSSWMSDDPFEQKKLRTIRSGSKIVQKSRVFEQDQNSRAKKECDIKAGSVEERQAWLSGAFKHDEETTAPQISTLHDNKRVWQPKKKETPEKELKSVKDKKEWLSNAFKKNGGDGQQGVGGGSPAIQHTKSFETSIHHTKSFEVPETTVPSIVKSASADGTARTAAYQTIHQTKSYDGTSTAQPPTKTFERQQSVVRLYKTDDKVEEESPEKTLKSVSDKQAWLSNAFKKPGGNGVAVGHVPSPVVKDVNAAKPETEVAKKPTLPKPDHDVPENNDDTSDEEKEMSVADRAKWLKGAFK